MTERTLTDHLVDIGKGVVGAALTAALLAGLQYLGAQIPGLIDFILTSTGATAAIKAMKHYV